jgi:hypothetical protein
LSKDPYFGANGREKISNCTACYASHSLGLPGLRDGLGYLLKDVENPGEKCPKIDVRGAFPDARQPHIKKGQAVEEFVAFSLNLFWIDHGHFPKRALPFCFVHFHQSVQSLNHLI